jgi:hypothetical protein
MDDDELDRIRANQGHGMTAQELGTQFAMGGIATAAIGLIFVLLIVAGFVIAGVLSIVAAVVIVALLRLFEWQTAPAYGQAYKASVLGIFGFVAAAFLINEVLPVHEYIWDPDVLFVSNSHLLNHIQQPGWSLRPILPTLLARFGPGLLICAYMLQRSLGESLTGAVGYLKAVLVSLLAVLVSSYVVAILGVRFVERIVRPEYALQIFLGQIPGSVIAMAVFSVVGGLFASLVIVVATRVLRSTEPFSTGGGFYRTAVIGLFTYCVVNMLVLFVYQDARQLDDALERMIASGDPLDVFFSDGSLFAAVPFQDYFVWQLPGLLLSAAILTARVRGPFLGPAGYLKACLVGEVAWPAGLAGIFGICVALVYLLR